VKKQFFNEEEPDIDYSTISQFTSIGTKTSSKNKVFVIILREKKILR
jgi:hypothetical protein